MARVRFSTEPVHGSFFTNVQDITLAKGRFQKTTDVPQHFNCPSTNQVESEETEDLRAYWR